MSERSLQLTFDSVPEGAVVFRRGARPGRLKLHGWYLVLLGLSVLVGGLNIIRFLSRMPSTIRVIGAVWIGLFVVLGAVAFAEARWRRLIVSQTSVTLTGVGMRSRVARADIDHLLLARMATTVVDVPALFLVGRDGRNLMRLPPRFDVQGLSELLGVPVNGGWDEGGNPEALNARLPGAVPVPLAWVSSHPYKVAAISAGVALILVVGMVFILFVSHPHA